jgi:hypothetical protein
MPPFDAPSAAALAQEVIRAADFAFFDFFGDPLRVTSFGMDVTVTGSGDPELDGTYSSISSKVIDLGDVDQKEGGSGTLICSLSGMLSLDQDLLAEIADTSQWRGRTVRRWKRLYDASNAAVGAFVPYYTGYMVSVEILPSAETQTIRLQCENYLALLNRASNRSYLGQREFDSGDLSAAATIGAANGASAGPGAAAGGGGFGGSVAAFAGASAATMMRER